MSDSSVSLGKVTGSKMGPHTLLQIAGLDGVVQQTVVLLLPPGYSANPAPGSDLALLQVLGSSDHVLALGGGLAGHAIPTLAPGEFGLSDGTQMVIFGGGIIRFVTPTKVRIEAPRLECTGAIVGNCDAAPVGLTTHTHAHGPAPDPNS